APAPGQELVAGDFAEREDRQIGEEQTRWSTKLWPGRDKATVFVGAGPLHREQYRATPLAADADTLDQADDRQQHRAPDADAFIGWYQADGDRRETGYQKCGDERRLPPNSIAPMAKNRRPDWASDKTDEEHPEGLQHADERIGAREKELAENQSRDL